MAANLWKPSLLKSVAQIPRQVTTAASNGNFVQKVAKCCSNQQCRSFCVIPRQGNTAALKGTFGQKTLECCSNQQCRCISVNTVGDQCTGRSLAAILSWINPGYSIL